MDNKIKLYIELAESFKKNGFSLWLVGGTVRDYLLNKELTDMDLVTNATPNDMKAFLEHADYTFERFGSVKLLYKGVKFDITTLRKENEYQDSRHPNKIEFTDSLEIDVKRRDLTINALYMNDELKVIDYVNGVSDIDNKIIRFVGEAEKRISEDPLRIIRTYRFALETGFEIESSTKKALELNFDLVKKLNIEKIKEEIRKSNHKEDLIKLLKSHNINIDLK